MDYLNSPFNHPMFNTDAAITAFNTILSWSPSSNSAIFSGAKNTKFYLLGNGEEKSLGPVLIALKGCYSSVRTSVGRLLINVNVCTSAFLLIGHVDLIIKLFPTVGAAEAFLKIRRISTDYLGGKRIKVITSFARDQKTNTFLNALQATITLRSGETISIAEFFKREHPNGIPLIDPQLPLILAGTSKIDERGTMLDTSRRM